MRYNCLAKTTRIKRNKARTLPYRKYWLYLFNNYSKFRFDLILTQKNLVFANNLAANWNLCVVMHGKLSEFHPNGCVVH